MLYKEYRSSPIILCKYVNIYAIAVFLLWGNWHGYADATARRQIPDYKKYKAWLCSYFRIVWSSSDFALALFRDPANYDITLIPKWWTE